MVHEAVGAVGGCTCVAHPAPVRRQAATQPFDVRDDVAPEVGRGGVAVKEDDRLARAGVYVGDLGLEQGDSVTLVRVGGRNGFAHAVASCRSFVGINSASMGPRPEARCPARALFTEVPRMILLRGWVNNAGWC